MKVCRLLHKRLRMNQEHLSLQYPRELRKSLRKGRRMLLQLCMTDFSKPKRPPQRLLPRISKSSLPKLISNPKILREKVKLRTCLLLMPREELRRKRKASQPSSSLKTCTSLTKPPRIRKTFFSRSWQKTLKQYSKSLTLKEKKRRRLANI